MYAIILAALLAGTPETKEAKVCKMDRVRSPVKAASIPRIRCVLAKQQRHHMEDETALARTMTFDYSIPQE